MSASQCPRCRYGFPCTFDVDNRCQPRYLGAGLTADRNADDFLNYSLKMFLTPSLLSFLFLSLPIVCFPSVPILPFSSSAIKSNRHSVYMAWKRRDIASKTGYRLTQLSGVGTLGIFRNACPCMSVTISLIFLSNSRSFLSLERCCTFYVRRMSGVQVLVYRSLFFLFSSFQYLGSKYKLGLGEIERR